MTGTGRLLRIARDARPAATDGDLLARYARDRDEAAFAELVHRNGPLVFRACRSVLGEATAAEDAFQATFLVLARNAGRLTVAGALAGWLHATAVRVARGARRTHARARRREMTHAGLTEAGHDSPDDLTWREVRELIDAELAALPEAYRTPLVLCYLQELSYDEAAARAGCSVGALRGRLERGKDALRKRLARRGLPLALPALALGGPAPVSAAVREAALATVRAAGTGGRVPAAVAALAGVRAGWRTAVLVPAAVLAALGVGLIGVARPVAEQPPAAAAPRTAGPTDAFGDPLPDGALMRLGTTRSRAAITGFGIAPDGTVVTVGPLGDVSLWSPKDDRPGKTVRLPVPRRESGPEPAVSPDGRYIAAATAGREVKVWERAGAEFREVAAFKGDALPPLYMRFSPDGQTLAAVGRHVTLCDLGTKQMREVESSSGNGAVAFSGDGKRLATTTPSRDVALWDVTDGKKLGYYTTGPRYCTRIALDRTGGVLVRESVSGPDTVVFEDPLTGTPVPALSGPENFRCRWASFAPDGKTVLLCDDAGITQWDPAAKKVVRRFDGAAHGMWAGGHPPARFSPDGKTLVGFSARMLFRWDAETGRPLFPESQTGGHHADVVAVGFSRDGKWIATGGHDATVRVWDAATGKPVVAVPAGGFYGVPNVELSADGGFVFAPARKGVVTKWEVATGRPAATFEFAPEHRCDWGPMAYRLSPDGRELYGVSAAQGQPDRPVFRARWDAWSGAFLSGGPLDSHILSLDLSPDGRWAATERLLYPVEVGPAGGTVRRLEQFAPAEFSADSRLVAKFMPHHTPTEIQWRANVFEVVTGEKIASIPVGKWDRVGLHPDGRSVAVANAKGLTFHDLGTGNPFAERKADLGVETMRPITPRQTVVQVVRYSPDGSKVVTGLADSTALVWPVPARPKAKPLDDAGRAGAWADLVLLDGEQGWAAVRALGDDPGGVAFLRGVIKPTEPLPARLFAPPTRERLRVMRAVAAVELAGTPDSRRLLDELAAGPSGAAVTHEAKLALDRLGK